MTERDIAIKNANEIVELTRTIEFIMAENSPIGIVKELIANQETKLVKLRMSAELAGLITNLELRK